MKIFNYKKAFIATVVLLFSISCNKDFLETLPTTAVGATEAVATTVNGYAALNGIHRIMYVQYDQQGEAGEGSNNIFRDLLGEDIVYPLANGSTGLIGFLQWTNHRNVNSVDLRYVYRYYYRIISNANVLINGIDGAAGPDADKKIIKGQALAYRAWAHFQLVQLWGKRYVAGVTNSQLGVPLLINNNLTGQPRATVEEVYTQINKDLDDAITLLAGYTRSGSAAKSNFSQSVAQGMKARVALTQQNWAVAATNAIAARTGFTLMTNAEYQSGFNNVSNQEWIWGSRQIDDQQTFFYSYFAYISCNFNSTVIRTQPRAINQVLWTAIQATDIRKKMWDLTGANVDVPQSGSPLLPVGARCPYQNQKFRAKDYASSVGDVPYMRAGEMYLIEAEARARQGGQDAAAQTALFNLLVNRNPSYTLSTNTGQALIDEIMFNRRVELWGEGFRFLDLKRLNLPLNRNGIANHLPSIASIFDVPAGDNKWEWLFPQDEMNANKAIVQNPL